MFNIASTNGTVSFRADVCVCRIFELLPDTRVARHETAPGLFHISGGCTILSKMN